MGASSWSYFVEYDENPARALAALRERVFADGEYQGPGGSSKDVERPDSIASLLEIQAEDGTHSILDIARVSVESIETVKRRNPFTGEMQDVPKAFRMMNPRTGRAEDVPAEDAEYGGTCKMATAEQLRTAFGTERPTRKTLESGEDRLYQFLSRWQAICVIAWKNEKPDGLFFCGISGD